MDIKGFFDAIDHDLLMHAVDKHVKEPWQLLYIRRWLEAPVQHSGGYVEQRTQGTPQGGVISPLLANLFLHYSFDIWVERHWKGIQFERYADDIICHCHSEKEAVVLRALLVKRFKECGLELHPKKTKIVYCKSWRNRADYSTIRFDFLGFTFRPRLIRTRQGKRLVCFLPAVSQKAAKQIRSEIIGWPWLKWVQDDISVIIRYGRSRLRGWMEYYGKFGYSAIANILFHFDMKLSRWALRKYKKLKTLMQSAKRVNALRGGSLGLLDTTLWAGG